MAPAKTLGFLILPWLLLPGAPAHAQPTEYQVNVREACRREVAGAYLAAYDDREQHRTLVRTLDARLGELRDATAKARADLHKAQAAVDAKSFDAQLAGDRDAAQSVVRSLEKQLAGYEAQRRTAAAEVGPTQDREARLRAAVGKVFVLQRVEDKPDGGYPFQLDYRAPCPKYRALCPLPARDADELKALDLGKGVPEPCSRYAAFSRIP